jgi:hypothetical protein
MSGLSAYRKVRLWFLFIDEKPFLIFRCTRTANSFMDQPDRFLHCRQLQILALDDPRRVFDHLARWKSSHFNQPSNNHLTHFEFFRCECHGHPGSFIHRRAARYLVCIMLPKPKFLKARSHFYFHEMAAGDTTVGSTPH